MKQFLKANTASLIATGVDYLVTILLKEMAGTDALLAGITGTVSGGITNFLICRLWVFKEGNLTLLQQGRRYLVFWIGYLLLNMSSLYVLIQIAGCNYILAKIVASLAIAAAYTYPVQKWFVFKNNKG
ncbi:MAG TPA: GtrA family protein [Ferruginibacter sp.]|nr:GtrA family protein [Ferruginibacter sp.]HMP21790.1 GtrA family protein [Ferruginibacter sp.]